MPSSPKLPANPYAPPHAALLTEQPLAERRTITVIPRVLGILSIVFGTIALLAVALMAFAGVAFHRARTRPIAPSGLEAGTGAGVKRPQGGSSKTPKTEPSTKSPSTKSPSTKSPSTESSREATSVIAGLLLVVGFAFAPPTLIIFGVGMLGYRRWARRASLGWAWAVLGTLVLTTALIAVGKGISDGLAMAFLWFVFMPYPIVLLALVSRPRVREAMSR